MKIPETVPPLPPAVNRNRNLAPSEALNWLAGGWRDVWVQPASSIVYGVAVCLISYAVLASLYLLAFDYILFPALSGFLIVAPALAIGLYEKSRMITRGEQVDLRKMVFVRPASRGQIFYTGVLLCLIALLWNRAAVILYAIFFGLTAFPGIEHIVELLLTPKGIGLLVVGSLVGGLFAAFGFAISVFSIPMLLNEKSDALTAMGTSMALVWSNLPVLLVWGAIVLGLSLLGMLTGMLGFIIIFPLLGHATWHAYLAIRQPQES